MTGRPMWIALDKLMRRWQIAALSRLDTEDLMARGRRRLLGRFRALAARVPAYATLLAEHGIAPETIRTPDAVLAHCPVLDKESVFGRFPLAQLCVDGDLSPLAGVLTSSGHGARFAFGLTTAAQGRRAARAIAFGLEYAFQTDRQRSFLINALPMGVRVACHTVTIAETSVREDMVAALVREVAPAYAQTILVLDPLFAKRLLDHARATGLDWSSLKVHVVLGEETYGEHFRRYLAESLGQDAEGWTRGFVCGSMGMGELGLNLFFETRESVRLRQFAHRHPETLRAALGPWPGRTPPLLFVYDPGRIHVEIMDADPSGFGALVISTLDPSLMLPLLRYRTGDRARLVDRRTLAAALPDRGRDGLALPTLPMLALAGRNQDFLPDGRPLLDFKDALYAEPALADRLSGALRIAREERGYCIHVQLNTNRPDAAPEILAGLRRVLPPAPDGGQDGIRVWPRDDFPFGRTLDYERKFVYLDEVRGI